MKILKAIDWVLDTLPGPALVYIGAASTALTTAAHEIAAAAPPGGKDVAVWLIRTVAWLGAAAVAIRRVTEVAKDQRGLLPPSR